MALIRTRGEWIYIDESKDFFPEICHLNRDELDRIEPLDYDIFISAVIIRTYIDGEII